MSTGKLVGLIILGIFIAFVVIYIVMLYLSGQLQHEHIYNALKDIASVSISALMSL